MDSMEVEKYGKPLTWCRRHHIVCTRVMLFGHGNSHMNMPDAMFSAPLSKVSYVARFRAQLTSIALKSIYFFLSPVFHHHLPRLASPVSSPCPVQICFPSYSQSDFSKAQIWCLSPATRGLKSKALVQVKVLFAFISVHHLVLLYSHLSPRLLQKAL